jgi:hypothetical protein
VCTHPVAGLHVSVVQILLSLQFLAVPAQNPPAQTSLSVQALLSLHGAVLSVCMQAPVAGSQESSVQTLPSSQRTTASSQSPTTIPRKMNVNFELVHVPVGTTWEYCMLQVLLTRSI